MSKLPADWEEVDLESLGEIKAGGTPSRGKKEYWGGGIPWLKISNLKQFYVKNYDETITTDGLNNSSAKLFPKNTILISIFASLGDVAILDIEATTNQAIAGIYNLNENVNKVYLAYYLKSLKTHFNQIGRGVAQNNINLSILKKTKVPLPPLETQKQIVSILEKAENTKEWRKEADELTKDFLKSVFVEMFGSKTQFEEVELNSVAKLINGRAYKRDELLEKGKTPVLRVGNFFSNRSWYYSDLDLEPNKYCHKGDLLYAWSASFGPKIWHGPKAIYHYHIWKVELSEKLNKIFMLYLLEQKTNEIKSSGHGIAMIHVTKGGMEKMKIPLPPIALQNKFASIVKEVESMKEHQKQSKNHLDNLFNALMQKAFKGELVV